MFRLILDTRRCYYYPQSGLQTLRKVSGLAGEGGAHSKLFGEVKDIVYQIHTKLEDTNTLKSFWRVEVHSLSIPQDGRR